MVKPAMAAGESVSLKSHPLAASLHSITALIRGSLLSAGATRAYHFLTVGPADEPYSPSMIGLPLMSRCFAIQ